MALDNSSLLAKIRTQYPLVGLLFGKHEEAINTLATNTATNATGLLEPPPKPEAISVQAGGGMVQVAITHNAPVQRGVNYFTEYDTNPAFTQPHVHDHGASRTAIIPLPAMNTAGTKYNYYFRSYAQYPGSSPSEHVVLGEAANPTEVQPGGTGQFDLIPSTGSGTASSNGTQGGQGLGNVVFRPAVGPKSAVGQS